MPTCAVHGTECKRQTTKFGPHWSCPEYECDQVTWHENQPTASQDVREAIKYLMDDLKAAIVLGSQPEYLDELYCSIGIPLSYCSIGIPLSSDGVTIQGIREDFRKYDQRMEKEATLVEIVLQLNPLTTAAGFKTHKSNKLFQDVTGTLTAKPTNSVPSAYRPAKTKSAPKAQPDAAIVDIAPKRKFNLE